MKDEIERARELLHTIRHASMATVNEDGSPHNSPFLFLHNPQMTSMYWSSHPDALHSVNILRTGQLFVVLYDAHQPGGLYIQAVQGRIAHDAELEEALAAHNTFRSKEDKPPITIDYYIKESPQRMWTASISKLWVNGSERDDNGLLIRDFRHEIIPEDLIDAEKV